MPHALPDIILYEDADFLVVNKPPFLATLEDRASPDNLLKLIRKTYPEASVGHRLDKETSGVLIGTKNAEAYRHIAMQFEKRSTTKTYHAVVDGLHQFDAQLVDAPIGNTTDGHARISREGKPSATYFQTLKLYKTHTLLECKPVTGRLHQIRVHAAYLKAPLSGDMYYGGKELFLSSIKRGYKTSKLAEEEPFLKRFALHSHSIEFQIMSGETKKIEAPYPKDFRALITQLEKTV